MDFIKNFIPIDQITAAANGNPAMQKLIVVLIFIVVAALYVAVYFILKKIQRRAIVFAEKKRGKNLSIQFIDKAITIALIIVFVIMPLGGQQVAQTLLGSTAVVAAVVGFAAQDAIKDTFAGLQISIYKPFNVGSRIEFEDGTAGVVESMTLRHIVLVTLDTTRAIIPNSRANAMKVINYSYGEVPRSMIFKFPISYESDIDKAKQVIKETICACPHTLNTDDETEDNVNSKSVYFLELLDSALVMAATVRYPSTVKSEVIKDIINSAVFAALKENNIEIPYAQVDVHMKPQLQ